MFIYNLYNNRKPKNEWGFSFLISDLYLILALSYYLISNWNELWQYPVPRLLAIILAAAWTYFGPIMIIRWMNGYNAFCEQVDKISGSNGCAGEVKIKELETYRWRNIIISLIWVALVVIVLILPIGKEVLKQYYFGGYGDPNYWIFMVCVAYIAYQTSWFFLFLLISGRTVKKVTENDMVVRYMLLNDGKSNGLSLIGGLVSRTAIYFSSGLLFFPIMTEYFVSAKKLPSNVNTTTFVFVLMAIYIFAVLLYLFFVNKDVVSKAQAIKDNILDELDEERKRGITGLDCYFIDQRIRYFSNISVNPIVTNLCLKILYGILISAFLPAVFSCMLSMGF